MTRVHLKTLGCKANQGDTDALSEGIAAALGGEAVFVGETDASDVVLLNTCTVTHTADADARQLARRYKRRNPQAKIIVTGCYAQTSRAELDALPEVDLVVGNIHKSAIPEMIARVARGESVDALSGPRGHRDWAPSLRDAAAIRQLPKGRSRPFVKVQDGCNYVCSFCIIPTARGKSRSIPIHDVVDAVNAYNSAGAREVVLTGIHLGHWGRDLTPKRRFGEMLARLLEETTVPRFRISSLEPNEVDVKVLDMVAENDRVCRHLHVPLQSGDDVTLGRMKRVYRRDWYTKIITDFRASSPNGAWGIDVMVGFPGEDDEAFQNTYRYLRDIPFTYLHVFPYSARRGTPAALMPDQVDPKVKRERSNVLLALSNERRVAHAASAIGRKVQVLVENRRVNGLLRGFSSCYVPVLFDGPDTWMDQLIDVEITHHEGINGLGLALDMKGSVDA